MSFRRRFVLLLLCLCVIANGSGFARAAPLSPDGHASMPPDCAQRQHGPSMSSMHDHATPGEHERHDRCKTDGCCCVGAHGIAMTSLPTMTSHRVLVAIVAPRSTPIAYSSPALARLARPPIS